VSARTRLFALILGASLAACGSLHGERPAVIAAPSASERAELARAVTLAFDGAPVTLADDAFTRDSVLSVERRTPAGPQGRAATGRTLDEPARLRLVLDGARCELVREVDGRRFPLRGVRCVPLEAAR
jgi:hypothetical protein